MNPFVMNPWVSASSNIQRRCHFRIPFRVHKELGQARGRARGCIRVYFKVCISGGKVCIRVYYKVCIRCINHSIIYLVLSIYLPAERTLRIHANAYKRVYYTFQGDIFIY